MIRLTTILLISSIYLPGPKSFSTKRGDIITITPKDTVVSFAGTYRYNTNTGKFIALKQPATPQDKDDDFWDSIVVKKLKAATVKNVHRFPKK